jgi:hypothetical protein
MGLRHLALSALFLCSCTPRAIEMRALNSVNPEPLQQENHLVCPRIPSTSALLPPAPYDEELGDCALVGRSEEIEAWLAELERIAASCRANRETNWASVLEVREDLDSQIDRLEDLSLGPGFMHAACPSHGLGEPAEPLEGDRSPTHHYTDWLKSIGEDVGQYCTMIDELVKPLWQACDEINFYLDCEAPHPEQYHSLIEGEMNAAEIGYNYTDSFYTNVLQTFGWGNFRTYFNEASIDCTLVQPPAPISAPIGEMLENAKCREGAGTAYDVMAYLQQGSIATIVGRNADWSWWMIQLGDQHLMCWVWSALVTTSDDTRQVLFVASPPLPTLTLAPQPHAPASAGCRVTTLQNPNGVCLPRACTPKDFPGTPCTP